VSAPFEIVCASTDRAAWLEARTTGIGASDMPAILGKNKYLSELELFLIKTGQVPLDDEDSEAAQWGHELEGKIVEVFGRRTSRAVTRASHLLRSTKYPWAMCTLDAWQVVPGYDRAVPLEAKLTGAFGRDWDTGVPDYFMPQVQQQMLVTDAPMASFACLINGTRLVHADVQRDEGMIAEIIEAGERFWRAVTDEKTPAPDGSKSAGWALRHLYAADDGGAVALDWTCESLSERHDLLCEQLAELEQEKERIRQTIQFAMGTATTGVLPGSAGGWTWKRQKRAGYTVQPTEFRAMRRVKARTR
jgi:putative phage-type endonuclease